MYEQYDHNYVKNILCAFGILWQRLKWLRGMLSAASLLWGWGVYWFMWETLGVGNEGPKSC